MIEVRMRFAESAVEGKVGDFQPREVASVVELVSKTNVYDGESDPQVPDEVWPQIVEIDGRIVYEIVVSVGQ